MADDAWNADFVRSLGMLLSGNAIEEVDERGEPIIGDTLLVLLNAPQRQGAVHAAAARGRPAVAAAWSTRSIRADRRALFTARRQLSAAGPIGRRVPGSSPPLRERRRVGGAAARAEAEPRASRVGAGTGRGRRGALMRDSRQSPVDGHQPAVEQPASRQPAIDRRPTRCRAPRRHRARSVRRSTAAASPSSARPANASTSPPTSSPTATTSSSPCCAIDTATAEPQSPHDDRGGPAGPQRRDAEGWRETPMTLANPGTDEWTGRFDVDGDRLARVLGRSPGSIGSRPGAATSRSSSTPARTSRWSCSKARCWFAKRRRARIRSAAAATTRPGCSTRADALARLDADRRPRRRSRSADDLAAMMHVYADRSARHGVAGLSRVGRSRARALRRVVRDVSALGRARPDAQRARSARRAPRCRASPTGLRRGLPAADSSDRPKLPERAQQQPRRRPGDPGSPWAIGSADGGHTAVEPGLGTLDDFDAFREEAERLGLEIALDLAWQCSPDHPGCASTPSGSAIGPTARSSTRRTRRRNTRTSTRSTSSARTGAALWQALLDGHAVLGRSRRAHLPRRQPAHQDVRLLGVADRRGARAATRDVIFLVRSVHAAEGDAVPGQGRVHPVVHLLHLAQHEGGADRVLHRADGHARRASTCGRTCSPTRPTSCTRTCSAAARPRSEARLLLAATLGANYGIYSGFELCENRPVRPGSEEYADSEKYQFRQWDWDRPGHIKELVARVNAIRHSAARAAVRPHAAVPRRPTTREIIAYSKTRARTDREPHPRRRQPRSAHMQHGFVRAVRSARPDDATSVRDLLDDVPSTPGAASGTTCASIRTSGRDTF